MLTYERAQFLSPARVVEFFSRRLTNPLIPKYLSRYDIIDLAQCMGMNVIVTSCYEGFFKKETNYYDIYINKKQPDTMIYLASVLMAIINRDTANVYKYWEQGRTLLAELASFDLAKPLSFFTPRKQTWIDSMI